MLLSGSALGLLGLGSSAAAASTNAGSGQIGTDATPLAKVITNQLNGADIQNATSGNVLESDGNGGLTFAAAGGGGTSLWEENNNYLEVVSGLGGPRGIAVGEAKVDQLNDNGVGRITANSELQVRESLRINNLDGNGQISFSDTLPDESGDPLALNSSNQIVRDTSIGGGGGTTSVSSLVTSGNSETGLEVFDANTAVSSSTGTNVNVVGGNADNNSNTETVQGVTLFGSGNVAETNFSTVSGGQNNTAGNAAMAFTHATVAGGEGNTASGIESFVGGGRGNTASGDRSAIPGGGSNTASGDSAICLGENNEATGQYGVAIGQNAAAGHTNAVVISDGEMIDNAKATSEGQDEFRVQASGGIFFQSVDSFKGNYKKPDITIRGALPTGTGNSVAIDNGKLVDAGTSSARYKTNIEPLGTDTSGVLDLQPTAYEYEETGQADTGLIAEEVDEALPEIVNYDDEGRPDAVRYDRVGMFLAPEVSENRDRLETVEVARDECEATIETLETDIESKDARLEDQRDRIDHLESKVENKSELLESVQSIADGKDVRIAELEAENAELEARLTAIEVKLGFESTAADASVADD
jgi:hypothetical protein